MNNDSQPTTTGTWDDWLATRAQPEPGPGETAVGISSADFMATVLGYKQYEVLDLGLAPMREGLRELMDEFERDTAGMMIQPRVPALPSQSLTLSITATPEGAVRVLMTQENGATLASDYSIEKATAIAALLLDTIRTASGEA